MIVDLRSYRDLGRCSYATLMDRFDSGKDHIYLGYAEVEIRRVEDLFPFLWRACGSYSRNGDVTHAHFGSGSPDSHWHADFDPSIARHEADLRKLERKLRKDPGNRNAYKWARQAEYEKTSARELRHLVDRLDEERRHIELQILKDNHGKQPASLLQLPEEP